ncbi:MAG: helix-turn-helix transcriptional regulator [Mesorhizobium sp.]|uniref:helix-turn-helix domain-containing protein n=1 Tax=Mesorhizobium sp. TaxID=1871066 RepID=UPI00120EC15E|nr:helix-turn-helix transcriptional regulator [Mesorhizobium sp.]TIQ37152.1 MAG: helix-turn-helix transcriptional regulator [Mesorhizobium sp.]
MTKVEHLTPHQSREARRLLNWSRVRLAVKSSLGEGTIGDFENGRRIPRSWKLAAMRQALEGAGVVFAVGGPKLSDPPKGEAGTATPDG